MNCTKRLRRAIDRDRARSGVFAATVMYRPCATSNFSSKEDLRHENAPRHSVFAPRRLATTRPALRAHRGCRRRRGVRREADVTELLATREQTGGALGLFRQTIAPKSGPPTHIHQAEDEFFYVVNGEFNFKLGDRVVSAPARSIVFVPRGIAHTFQNVGTEPGMLLVGVTPGGFEKMFAERQDVDAETNRTLMKMHNMEVVGPPLR
jgi:quercetin dioxygenase-like cupin family protein